MRGRERENERESMKREKRNQEFFGLSWLVGDDFDVNEREKKLTKYTFAIFFDKIQRERERREGTNFRNPKKC